MATRAANGEAAPFGEGPCVERGDTLYVFDQAVLTAFDLATGNARWRLPSVGVVGLFFDDKGMLYVNTTTADPENIKYSRQIDITQKIEAILLKIDPQTGRTLWSIKPGGFISYLSGKFIYTVQFFDPGDEAARRRESNCRRICESAASAPRTAGCCGNMTRTARRWMCGSRTIPSNSFSKKKCRC